MFFQDTYQLNIEQIFVAGLTESGGAAPALSAQTGAEVRELVASSNWAWAPGRLLAFVWQAWWGRWYPNMRVSINLATQPYEDVRRFWTRWGIAVAALSLITLVLLYSALISVVSARKDRDLMRQRQEQIAARDQEKASAEAQLSLPQNRNMRDRSNFLNDAFQRKSFSWTRVFEDLEQVMPPRLHVVSIHPATAEDNQLQIKLVVAGESRERAEDLVKKMEGSRRFQETHIESEMTQQANNGSGDNVVFDITANYVPDAGDAKMQGGQ